MFWAFHDENKSIGVIIFRDPEICFVHAKREFKQQNANVNLYQLDFALFETIFFARKYKEMANADLTSMTR